MSILTAAKFHNTGSPLKLGEGRTRCLNKKNNFGLRPNLWYFNGRRPMSLHGRTEWRSGAKRSTVNLKAFRHTVLSGGLIISFVRTGRLCARFRPSGRYSVVFVCSQKPNCYCYQRTSCLLSFWSFRCVKRNTRPQVAAVRQSSNRRQNATHRLSITRSVFGNLSRWCKGTVCAADAPVTHCSSKIRVTLSKGN